MAAGRKTGGRKKGSRNKPDAFGPLFRETLLKDFRKHGASVLERVRENQPADYLKVAARLVPQEVEANLSGTLTVRWED